MVHVGFGLMIGVMPGMAMTYLTAGTGPDYRYGGNVIKMLFTSMRCIVIMDYVGGMTYANHYS